MRWGDIHSENLATATALSGFSVAKPIPPLEVIAILNQQSLSFMLMGAYGLSGWIDDARATEDVDVLVATRHPRKL